MSLSNQVTHNSRFDVVVAGDICLDIIPNIPDLGIRDVANLLHPGKIVNVSRAVLSTGGPVSNTGIAFTKLGFNVAFIAKIGDDEFGELILKLLKKYGSAQGIKIASGLTSSYTIAIVPPGIDRIYLHDSGTNDFFDSNDVDFNLVQHAKIFHLGYPTLMRRLYENEGSELRRIFCRAKEAGATTSMDMSLPDHKSDYARVNWLNLLKQTLPYVDIFLPSIEEAFYFLEPNQYLRLKSKAGNAVIIDLIEPEIYSQLAQRYLEMGAKVVGLKCAHQGFYIRTAAKSVIQKIDLIPAQNLENWADRELWSPAFHVPQIASAIGAGDSAIAGFLSALIKCLTIEESLKFANCLGYQNLQKPDAVSGIKSWQETQQIVEETGLQINLLLFKNRDWNWDATQKIWIGPSDRPKEIH